MCEKRRKQDDNARPNQHVVAEAAGDGLMQDDVLVRIVDRLI